MKEIVRAPGVFSYDAFGFRNCVRYGSILYVSGTSGLDADGRVVEGRIEAQTVATFKAIEAILRAGGSGLDRILAMTSFIVNLEENGQRYVQKRASIISPGDYTSATIGVSALMVPGLLLEVQCQAACDT